MSFHQLLEFPAIYRAAQVLLAPGMDHILTNQIQRVMTSIQAPEGTLDVGCGPSSWLWKLGVQPIGLDLSHAYAARFRAAGGNCVTASAAEIPFPTGSFDAVFSVALLHHLPDDVARQTVQEIVRVTRVDGHVLLFDPVLPKTTWTRPLAWTLCKLDRGRFIRPESVLRQAILGPAPWRVQRITHSYLGTEGLLCLLKKEPASGSFLPDRDGAAFG
jgi:SAM-dependent methyltransferase